MRRESDQALRSWLGNGQRCVILDIEGVVLMEFAAPTDVLIRGKLHIPIQPRHSLIETTLAATPETNATTASFEQFRGDGAAIFRVTDAYRPG